MRIALVCDQFAPTGGGLARAAWELARALVDVGDEVHVIAGAAEPLSGAQVHRLDVPSTSKALHVLELSRAARRVVEARSFDAVHGFARVHVQDLFHAGVGCHAAYLSAVHGLAGRAWRRAAPRHAVQLQLEGVIARDPRIRIQCVSERVAREFREHYDVPQTRLRVIPNGVDVDRFASAALGAGAEASREALRRRLAPGADAVWLYAGSGFRRKGLDVAMRALAASRIERSVLWVVGRDRTSSWQRRAARFGVGGRVRFLGERSDVPELIAASDGLLLPTRYEPGGMVTLEAAACGRPIVTSASCGHVELLEGAALVVPDPDDFAGFAAALDRLADGGLRARLGRAGRARVEALRWRDVAAALRDEYADIAAARKARR